MKTAGKCLEKKIVSIARRSHMQKHLNFSNVKELYAKFKSSYPDIKTCFSNFCLHRLKWWITVRASGTHTVCVSLTETTSSFILNK